MADTSVGTRLTDPLRPRVGSATVEADRRAARGERNNDIEPLRGTVALLHPRAFFLTDHVAVGVERLPPWQPQIWHRPGP